jgi:hypothetical protein
VVRGKLLTRNCFVRCVFGLMGKSEPDKIPVDCIEKVIGRADTDRLTLRRGTIEWKLDENMT